jgi:DNA-binding IclR family transcriptional regulator
MAIPNLFRGPVYETAMGKLQTYVMSSSERIAMVRQCESLPALKDALACGDLQRTVEDAIRRRIRRLESS